MGSTFGDKGWSGKFAKNFANFVVQSPYKILLATVATVVLLGVGAKNLEVTDDYHMWFDKNSPELKSFEKLETTYAKSDSILFVIAPKDGNVFTRQTLADIQWLTKESWKIPFSTRVDSLTNFQKTEASGDDLKVRDLVLSPESMTSADLSRVRKFAMNEPALVKNLVSEKGHVGAVNVVITLAGKAPTETSDVAAYARDLKRKLLARDPNIKVYLTGILISNANDAELSSGDMEKLVPLMYLFLMVSLGIMLRTLSGVVISLVAITLAVLGSMGLSGWLGYQINTISAIAPTIIMTLAISDCVHVLVTFLQQMRQGTAKEDAVRKAITYNLYPSAMTSLANMVGFASMNFNELPPFRQFGNTIAIGSILELALAFLFIPALLFVLPLKFRQSGVSAGSERPTRFEEGLASFVIRHRLRLTLVLTAVTIFFGFYVSKNHLNENWVAWYSPRLEFRRDTDFTAKNLSGMYDIQFSLNTNEGGGIYRPDFLRQVDSFVTWLRHQPEVVSVGAVTDDLKRVNRTLHGDNQSWYRTPNDRKLAAQYFLLYDMSLPYGMSLTNQVSRDKSSTRVIARIKNITMNEILAFDKRAHSWSKSHTPLLAKPESYSSSMTMLFALMNSRLLENLVAGVGIGFVVISVLLMLLFRSVKLGIIGLVPNLVPAVITFGLWGMFDGVIGTAIALVCSATLGIVVDSTIHFLNHYLVGRRELKLSPEQSIFHAFARAGTAICVTDLVLMIGFATLMLSNFSLNSVLGQMTALMVVFDIFATLLLSVPIILFFENRHGKTGGTSFLEGLMKEGSVVKTLFKKRGVKASAILLTVVMIGIPKVAQSGNKSPETKGIEIAERADKKRNGYHDYTSQIKMVLKTSASDAGAVNRLRMSFLETPGDADKELATFLEPGDVKGTSLLTFSHKHGEDDQWLYLPSLKRVKRISSTNKSGAFMGSEFAYEDMTYEVLGKYTYKFLRQEKCEVGMCDLLEEVPSYANSGYSRIVAWYDTKESREVKIEYFDRKNTLLKTFKTSGWKQFLGHWWRATKMEMVNAQNGNITTMDWSEIKFHAGLATRDFDTNSLQRAQ
jgi:uncharacterized protein